MHDNIINKKIINYSNFYSAIDSFTHLYLQKTLNNLFNPIKLPDLYRCFD